MTEATTKYRLIIKTTGPCMLYPIINTFCSDSGLSFNDAKTKLTLGAALEFTSKEQADNAAAKYRKLGCSVDEDIVELKPDQIGDINSWICPECEASNKSSSGKCVCGFDLYQGSNELPSTSIDKNISDDSEEINTGFAGIGKRIDDLKTGSGTEDAKAWKQATAEPQQEKPESVKQEATQKVYTPKPEKKTRPSSSFSFAKVFLVIVGLLILISFFSKGSNNTSSNRSTQPSAPSAPTETQTNYPSPTTNARLSEEIPPVGSGHSLTTSQIRYCIYQKQRIEIIRGLLDSANSYHINNFNELVDDYNSRCSSFRYRRGSLQSVQQELGNANSQLQEEARQLVSSWGYSSGSQNTGTTTNAYQPSESSSRPSNNHSSRPDFSRVTSSEKASMEAACVSAYYQGAASYNRCLSDQLNRLRR
jgi:hypothetical protein